jgi:hypothetical protein
MAWGGGENPPKFRPKFDPNWGLKRGVFCTLNIVFFGAFFVKRAPNFPPRTPFWPPRGPPPPGTPPPGPPPPPISRPKWQGDPPTPTFPRANPRAPNQIAQIRAPQIKSRKSARHSRKSARPKLQIAISNYKSNSHRPPPPHPLAQIRAPQIANCNFELQK